MSRRPSTDAALADAITRLADQFVSPNVADSNLEPANIVDALASLARAMHRLADALDTRRADAEAPHA